MPPRVSIIVPCFNGARYIPGLARSLAPVLACGEAPCEVIVVDDGSTDDSADLICQHLPAAQLIRQFNRGVSAARNAGVAVACGEYLQLLDVDDTIEPAKLATQAAAADQARADVAYSDWRLLTINGENIRTEVFAPALAPGEMVESLLTGWYVPPVGYLFRRSSYLELGGCDETIKVWEDFDLFLRFALADRPHVYAPGILANYHRYLAVRSLGRSDPRISGRSRERILRASIATLARQGRLTGPRRRAAARAFFAVLRTANIPEPGWLRGMAATIRELDPAFRPPGNLNYRTVAALLGLAAAERVAVAGRNWLHPR